MTLDIRTVSLDDPAAWEALTRRSATPEATIVAAAARIVADVAEHGDAALHRYDDMYGGALADGSVCVPSSHIEGARDRVSPGIRSALETTIDNVTRVHESQRPGPSLTEPTPGIIVERVWSPASSVGVYVPGGRAAYPSSLVMGVTPARIAGVGDIAVATPARPDGSIDDVVLAAADLLEVDRVHAMGGAQAVAALAHGTRSVPRTDIIVGPGGPWVTAAKLAVIGVCGIDMPAGPSEAVIIADGSADPSAVAADIMCQAEHGEESSIVFVCSDATLSDEVLAEIDRSLDSLDRSATIRTALEECGLVALADSVETALAFANDWAPEHLSIHTQQARRHADAVPNAGSVFVGHWTPEAAGDYATGANHVLPTGGLARAYGPLSVEDFGSWRQIQTATPQGLEALAPTIVQLAEAEGFTAHAHSVRVRMDGMA